jgi:GNAT superfamily N-acetyltransferase
MIDVHKIAPFFDGWEETLIWSCLQECMGYAIANNDKNPSAALITVGDFCFLAGDPNHKLAAQVTAPIIVPRNEEWGKVIEAVWGNQVDKGFRYAIKKESDVFDTKKLTEYTNTLPDKCVLKLFDEEIYKYSLQEQWSKDLCSQFSDYNDFNKRGIGVAVIYQGTLVAGASSYTVYHDGIEIEIDTKPEFRQNGFATACGARLILECLKRGLYPSWDAHDLRSVALAEKLGYHMDAPYVVYTRNGVD